MRNLFDQYSQPENRLTHALAVSLNEDSELLRRFIRWVGPEPPRRRLTVVEQTLPGEAPPPEPEAERRGLPDIVIHDGESWCLLIESKVQARLTTDQLDRHVATLRRRGFTVAGVLALTKSNSGQRRGVTPVRWSDLYSWLGREDAGRDWAARLRGYLRIAEVRLAREGYLTEGTLTMFDGFKFDADNPYSYGEAKRLLKLATTELRKQPALVRLGADVASPGRPAITGSGSDAVWDCLLLKGRPSGAAHTAYPHLTLEVHRDFLGVQISIPNETPASVRNRLASLGVVGLAALHEQVLRSMKRALPAGGTVEVSVVQRHHVSQRSAPTIDARLSFRLETTQPGGTSRVREQREWLEAFVALLQRKRSNIHFGYVARIPWGSAGLDSEGSIGLITALWVAFQPVMRALGVGK